MRLRSEGRVSRPRSFPPLRDRPGKTFLDFVNSEISHLHWDTLLSESMMIRWNIKVPGKCILKRKIWSLMIFLWILLQTRASFACDRRGRDNGGHRSCRGCRTAWWGGRGRGTVGYWLHLGLPLYREGPGLGREENREKSLDRKSESQGRSRADKGRWKGSSENICFQNLSWFLRPLSFPTISDRIWACSWDRHQHFSFSASTH